jgi:GAF domain-containing protein
MLQPIRKILAPPVFENDDEKTFAARLLNVILWAGIAIFILAGLVAYLIEKNFASLVVLSLLTLVYLGLVYAMHLGFVRPVSYLVTLAAFVGITAVIGITGGIFSSSIPAFITVSLIAGLLLGLRSGIFVTLLSTITTLAIAIAGSRGLLPESPTLPGNYMSAWTTLTVITISTTTFFILAVQGLNEANQKSHQSEAKFKNLNNELEAHIREHTRELELANAQNLKRASRLRTIAEISQKLNNVRSSTELLSEITEQISLAFGFYHVAVYLLDPKGEDAVLRAANSQGGKMLLAQGQRIKIGQIGIVSYVANTGSPRVALDVGKDAVFFNSPELPETHSEVALPLRIGRNVIGVLDVQSAESGAFNNEDVDTLNLLADQISISIQNARLLEETQLALIEAQATYNQTARYSWREMTQRNSTGFRYANGTIEVLKEKPLENQAVSKTGRKPAISDKASDFEILAIPINLRGEELGLLNIRQPGRSTAWSEPEVRLYSSIVERLAAALENARLVEETNNRAERDRTITYIADKLGSSIRVETILRTAAEELSRVISGSEVLIQLQNEAAPDNLPDAL